MDEGCFESESRKWDDFHAFQRVDKPKQFMANWKTFQFGERISTSLEKTLVQKNQTRSQWFLNSKTGLTSPCCGTYVTAKSDALFKT